jgi:membrane-associated phospholipid phosphatase
MISPNSVQEELKPATLIKTSSTPNKPVVTSIVKMVLLFAVSFSFLAPAVQAQRENFDQRVLIHLMERRTDGATKFNQAISNRTQTVATLIPISVLAAGIITNDKTTMKKGLYIAASVAGSALITYAMKYGFDRNRPFNANPHIIPAGGGSSPSFPSGHTSTAFSAATSLTIAYPKWYVAVPAYAWAASVGYSRMYLGVHYPSDVLAGAAIGAGSAWLMYKANKWLFKKKPELRPQF